MRTFENDHLFENLNKGSHFEKVLNKENENLLRSLIGTFLRTNFMSEKGS